ncbi:MAG: hypothetical protein FJ299_10740 [Planctomycetes bacterium]|nr:hypothetical protein [Planctomycetota bacterium]
MNARKLAPRLALAVGSFAIAAGAAWWWFGDRLTGGGTTRITDNSAAARALLLERARGGTPLDPARGVMPEPIPEAAARTIFGSFAGAEVVYDAHSIYRYRSGLDLRIGVPDLPGNGYRMVTNGWGMRELDDPSAGAGRPCLLASGDSHTDGVCDAPQSWPNLLEAALRERAPSAEARVWNHGFGGYSFYEYLGTLRRCAELAPRLYVVCSYAGNDYLELIKPWSYFERREAPEVPAESMKHVLRESLRSPQAISQCLQQAYYFRELPHMVEIAPRVAARVSKELAAEAARIGCVALFVNLPCAADVQRERYAAKLAPAAERLGLSSEQLDISQHLADAWIAQVRAADLPVLDLRAAFRAEPEDLYWHSDHHINLRGQQLVAAAVLQWLDEQPPGSVLGADPVPR